jgi:hypothetical protein
MSVPGVRRDKAALSSGCKPHPATATKNGSGRAGTACPFYSPQQTSSDGPAMSVSCQDRKSSVTLMALSRELVEQRLRFLQVAGVEAFGEPAVDRREQTVGLRLLALVAPESGETDRGSQLE